MIENPFANISFEQFLDNFKASMKRAYHQDDKIDVFCSTRGIPAPVLTELMSTNPLALTIPRQYGGFGGNVKQNIAFISAASYESLALSLTLGINNALFIQPFTKYGQDAAKPHVFSRFLNNQSMGGLMITEPGYGSDALNMQTSVTEKNGKFHLQGKKHWQGLTGMAEFWLLTGRRKTETGTLMRDVEMFMCDVNAPNQKIVVEESYENLGLYQIPYGLNHLDVVLPEENRLIPQTTGVKMLLDLLHRSRFQFPAMGLGFIHRMMDEAITHAKNRLVGNKSLITYDQVQNRLARLQANFTICSAFCVKSGEVADIENDLFPLGLEANIIKTVTTDMMQESSQSLLQLVGGKGYRLNHIAGRSTVDSRPFQIFEGSNDILYHQIADAFLKLMKTAKEIKLYNYLKTYTPAIVERLRDATSFELDMQLAQRKLVELGQVVSRIYSMQLVSEMADKGFHKDLIENALDILRQDIASLINNLRFENKTLVVENYGEKSYWFDL
jgi:alkylation response protein AidB-like acyl-CoA dehydrogenase